MAFFRHKGGGNVIRAGWRWLVILVPVLGLNVDSIMQADQKPPEMLVNPTRQLTLSGRWLNLPIRNGAPKRVVKLLVDGKAVRQSEMELADGAADWWAAMDVAAFAGKAATITADKLPAGSQALAAIEPGDRIKGADDLYHEKLRAQFHFSPRHGWTNDPNGLVYHDGEYHLFFQHNPYGWSWGNMHWGHAVSRDLVHWEELPEALYPWTQARAHCFSGSAAVDGNNTAGFAVGREKALVAAFTDTGCGEALAYSTDRGRSWTYYPGNPVVKHQGRDPRIFWYAPGKHWVMAVYDEFEGKKWIAFHTSPDLKAWQFQSRIEGYFECPDVFELPVDGRPEDSRWVLLAADAKYALGRFDGKTFTPEHAGKQQVHWGQYYAAQTWNDAPGGRRIQIGWAQIATKGMPFNQMMSFPCALALRTTDEGVRLCAQPVKEIEALWVRTQMRELASVSEAAPVDVPVTGELLDIRAEFEVGTARECGLLIGQHRVTYDAGKQTLEGMPLRPVGGKVQVQALVDRAIVEVFGNAGRVCLTSASRVGVPAAAVRAWATGGDAKVRIEAHELRSIWP